MFDKFPQQFGPYVLEEKIGQGGMAEIFRANSTGPGNFTKEVAIKRILPSLAHNDDFITQFLDEARIAGSLSHPNIVQIYSVDQVDDHYYIAMEYVKGEHLGQVIRNTVEKMKLFPFPIGVCIINQVAKALHFAHTANDTEGKPLHIIHRDVSPQNIMIALNGGVKLTDFGIAKAANRLYQTTAGVIKGKFSYLAPEQLTGAPASVSSDIFALGVVFWELLAGRRLFQSNSDIKTIQLVQACKIPPLKKLRRDIPKELDEIIAKFLTPTPTTRYQSTAEVVTVLSNFLHTQGITEGTTPIAHFMSGLYPQANQHTNGNNDVNDHTYNDLGDEDLKTEITPQGVLDDLDDLNTHILPNAQFKKTSPANNVDVSHYLGEFEENTPSDDADKTIQQNANADLLQSYTVKKSKKKQMNRFFWLVLLLIMLIIAGGSATLILLNKRVHKNNVFLDKSSIEIEITPPHAKISLNGVILKKGELLGNIKYIIKNNGKNRTLEGLVGGIKYQISAKCSGYQGERRGIVAKDGDTYWMRIRLKKIPQKMKRKKKNFKKKDFKKKKR